MKNILQRIAVVVFGLLISGVLILSILEIYLRIFTNPVYSLAVQPHPQRGYALKPLSRGKTCSTEFKINSLGLRDYERTIIDDAYKIAVFGDSITFGGGVRTEKTFVKLLESKLNISYKNKLLIPIQVFNFGVPSYNTVQEYRYIKESYSTFKPNMIILEFTAENDALTLTDIFSGINKYRILRSIKDMLRNLYSYNFLTDKFYGLVYNWKLLRYDDPYLGKCGIDSRCYHESYEGWIEAKKAFLDIKYFCERNNIILIFAIFSNSFKLSSIPEQDLMYPIVGKVVEALKDVGVEHVIVIDDAFRNYAGKERLLWVTPTDSHFSELAHELVAEKILEYIDKHNLVMQY